MTNVQDRRPSPDESPPAPTGVNKVNETIKPWADFLAHSKVIGLFILAVVVTGSAFIAPNGAMCAVLTVRSIVLGGERYKCPSDDPPPEDLEPLPRIRIETSDDEKFVIADAQDWKPKSTVRLEIVDREGDNVKLKKAARTFKVNRHGSLGQRSGRLLLWAPPPDQPPGKYKVIAHGRDTDGTKRTAEVVVRVR